MGMYGRSMTHSRAATFTAKPVAVPARCLAEGDTAADSERAHPARHALSAATLPARPPVGFAAFNPLPGLVHLNVLVAMARDGEDAA